MKTTPTRKELAYQLKLAKSALNAVFTEMDLRTPEQFFAFHKVKTALAAMRYQRAKK